MQGKISSVYLGCKRDICEEWKIWNVFFQNLFCFKKVEKRPEKMIELDSILKSCLTHSFNGLYFQLISPRWFSFCFNIDIHTPSFKVNHPNSKIIMIFSGSQVQFLFSKKASWLSSGRFRQIFVAFLENLNFNKKIVKTQ